MTEAARCDVLIVGAGPVGLSMALALQHLGVECVVVDKHESPMDFPRGRGITVRSMELMRRWGTEALLREAGLPASSVAVFVGEGLLAPKFDRFVTSPARHTTSSPSERLICFQHVAEVVLRDAAIAADADLRFGWELVDAVDHGFVLLTTPAGTAWRTVMEGASGIPSQVHEIDHPDWPALYGVGPLGAMLVRPDGYVAFRAAGEPTRGAEVRRALTRVVGRS